MILKLSPPQCVISKQSVQWRYVLYLVVDKIIWLLFLLYKNTSINKCTSSLLLRDQTNKHAEISCFLNHNSSIHFCCTDCLLMTHCGGLSLSIIIWRIGGGGQSFLLPWGPKILLAALSTHLKNVHDLQNVKSWTFIRSMSTHLDTLGWYRGAITYQWC
jgi:hypothetical protein